MLTYSRAVLIHHPNSRIIEPIFREESLADSDNAIVLAAGTRPATASGAINIGNPHQDYVTQGGNNCHTCRFSLHGLSLIKRLGAVVMAMQNRKHGKPFFC
jgi:hypothetical protein